MDKDWIESELKGYSDKVKAHRESIENKIDTCEFLTSEDKKAMYAALSDEYIRKFGAYTTELNVKLAARNSHEPEHQLKYWDDIEKLVESLDINGYGNLLYYANGGIKRYADSDPIEFDGDIVITDPCYIMRKDHRGADSDTEDDWESCDYGYDMEAIGIKTYMTRDTLYGDWGCTLFDLDTKKAIGNFCADAGLVSVFLLDEVLKYNPSFNYHTERTWTTALVKDFKGSVQFVVEKEEGVYEEDTEWWKAGDKWEDYSVHVVGHGINKRTGKPINFYSSQTSL